MAGAYAGFLRGGAQLSNFWYFGYTCREAACREQRAFARGVWGHAPPRKLKKKWCNFVRFEGYFQPLSW